MLPRLIGVYKTVYFFRLKVFDVFYLCLQIEKESIVTTEAVTDMIRDGLFVILQTALPVLLISMAIGLIVSIFQTVTSIQEQTLTFVPKLVGIFVALMLFGNWMLNNMVVYATELWTSFSYYVHK